MIGTSDELIIYLKPQDKTKIYELKEYHQKRSLNANSYMWVVADKIAKELSKDGTIITKETIYRDAIKNIGQFEIIPIKNEAVNTFITAWQHNGLGWICERVGDSKIKGYTNVIAYYGSSIYDSKSMSLLIDLITQEARQLGIETMNQKELESLKESWK